MRPPEFTGGNTQQRAGDRPTFRHFNEAAGIHRRKRYPRTGPTHPLKYFNEAAGIHRRKREEPLLQRHLGLLTSMRPPEFTGGNTWKRDFVLHLRAMDFNEAAGIHRRKLTGRWTSSSAPIHFNEAAGIHRRKRCTPRCARA